MKKLLNVRNGCTSTTLSDHNHSLLCSLFLFSILFNSNILSNNINEKTLNQKILNWENKNKNQAVVLITSSESGMIEYVYNSKKAYYEKLPTGSIIKVLSAFVFLDNSKQFHFNKEEQFQCNGRFEAPNSDYFKIEDREKFNLIQNTSIEKEYFKCSVTKGHGNVNLINALSLSCNSYFLHYSSINSEYFYQTLIEAWKINSGTGASWEKKNFVLQTYLTPNTEFEYVLSSIGEGNGIRMTPLKIAQIFGSIFSNTPILKPIQQGQTPEMQFPFPFPESSRKLIQQALRLVVKNGTLKDIKIQNTNIKVIAGKTGTPTRSGKKFVTHGWNIIYFKLEDSPYLLVTFTEKGSAKKETLELSQLILNSL